MFVCPSGISEMQQSIIFNSYIITDDRVDKYELAATAATQPVRQHVVSSAEYNSAKRSTANAGLEQVVGCSDKFLSCFHAYTCTCITRTPLSLTVVVLTVNANNKDAVELLISRCCFRSSTASHFAVCFLAISNASKATPMENRS